jgi:glutamyl-tRNA reductase
MVLDRFLQIEPARAGRPLFIVDLAVPRDIDPRIGERPGVYLYSIDDLQQACERNRQERDRELPRALRIIDQETDRFLEDLHRRAIGPVVQQLRHEWELIKEEELRRLFNKLPNLDEQAEAAIRESFDRLVNKLLHPPMASLRMASRSGIPSLLLDAVRKLFQLKD